MGFLRKICVSVLVLSCCWVIPGRAGWSSGGGELIGDGHNPWWIQNTPTVRYCVEIDTQNFGVTNEKAVQLIEQAIGYWKRQFARSPKLRYGSTETTAEVATQDFIYEKNCADHTELRFQFGVLHPEQRDFVRDPRRFVSFAVRTEYDRKHLRGKGFVYVSPDSGPLSMEGIDAKKKPWTYFDGVLLYPVLLHELGHVFGLPHDPQNWLTSERSTEQTIQTAPSDHSNTFYGKIMNEFFVKRDPDSLFFSESFPLFRETCVLVQGGTPSPNLISTFFQIPLTKSTCTAFYVNADKEFILSMSEHGQPNRVLGKAKLHEIPGATKWVDAVKVYLTKEQIVFSGNHLPNSLVAAKAQQEVVYKGKYISEDGRTVREIGVRISPWGQPQVSGVLNGHLFMDLKNEQLETSPIKEMQ